MLITKRVLQASADNWGKPDKISKHKGVDLSLFPEEVKTKSCRRKKTPPHPYPGHCCPYCGTELPLDLKEIERTRKKGLYVLESYYRVKECACGAYEVSSCPACKRKTWFKDGHFKHQILGCGYSI